MKNTYIMILCGGWGERLWPLSRRGKPKQFISFLKNKSLLEQTIDRINLLAPNKENIGVVTTKEQKDYLINIIGNKIGFVIDEPASCNTGPAILYSCFKLSHKDKDAVSVFLPADSFVLQNEEYRRYLKSAVEHAYCNDKIITLGLMPTRAATGYGYIQAGPKVGEKISAGKFYKVKKFHEKPDKKLAEKYIHQSDMFWNIGVFVAKVSVFLKEFQDCAPELFCDMQDFLQNKISYEDISKISIDYAVMEKSKNVIVLPCVFEWDDIGNIDVFLSWRKRLTKDSAKIINVESERNVVCLFQHDKQQKEKLVVFVGVDDLCLVEEEDVILVAKRGEIEKVKKALIKIREESLEQFL